MAEREAANLDALSDLRTPWCLRVAVTLRIAEHIDAGSSGIEELAAAAGCDPGALHRVLSHLASKGVFEEIAPGRFGLNEAAQRLLEPGRRLDLDLEGIGGRIAYAWGTLLSAVRKGVPAYEELFGLPFWDDLDAHAELAASFDALMGPAGHGTPDPEFELTSGWDSVRTIVDVGGGTGAMLAEILRLRPQVRGILVDLPRTVARSTEIFEAAGVAGRVKTVGQSFFDPLPAGADLYLLKAVLNDWPDPEARAILRRCAESVRPGGGVVVMGGVTPDGASPGLEIDMVLVAGFKGRSLARFRELAREAGLEVVASGRQPSGRFFVECRPA